MDRTLGLGLGLISPYSHPPPSRLSTDIPTAIGYEPQRASNFGSEDVTFFGEVHPFVSVPAPEYHTYRAGEGFRSEEESQTTNVARDRACWPDRDGQISYIFPLS